MAEVLKTGADLLDRSELKGMAETVRANSLSLSAVDSRVESLDSKVTELISDVSTLQTSIRQDMDSLRESIQEVHTDVKDPIIVKRWF